VPECAGGPPPVAGVRLWSPAADRRFRRDVRADHLGWRQAWGAAGAGGSGGPGGNACSQGSHWFALRFNQLMGVRWRGRLLGSGPVRRRAPDPHGPVFYDVFWLLSCGF
jgi:hypothetical protein